MTGLGAVKPWVQGAADYLDGLFDLTGVGGWRASAHDMGGHPSGRALDLMVGANKAEGDRLATFLIANWNALQIDYIIWQQAIRTTGKPEWVPMATRIGEGDQNHFRHVHVNFRTAIDDGRTFTTAVEHPIDSKLLGRIPTREKPVITKGDPLDDLGNLIGMGVKMSPAGLLLGTVTDTDSLMSNLGSAALWIRVAQILGGAILVIGGVAILTKDMAVPAASAVLGAMPQGRAAKIALGAAGAGKK